MLKKEVKKEKRRNTYPPNKFKYSRNFNLDGANTVDNPEQVSQNLEELRTSWYSISKLCQGLKRYKSTKDEGFVGSLDSIISAVEGFERLTADVYQSIIDTFPSHPKKLESEKDEILEAVAGFKEKVREDQSAITSKKEKDKTKQADKPDDPK